jgi:hypothetical protein
MASLTFMILHALPIHSRNEIGDKIGLGSHHGDVERTSDLVSWRRRTQAPLEG